MRLLGGGRWSAAQASCGEAPDFLRRRIAQPIAANPISIIAQVPGSGAAEIAVASVKLSNSPRLE
jgi:hypothetical protein